jgi:hypothetical protein
MAENPKIILLAVKQRLELIEKYENRESVMGLAKDCEVGIK